MGDRLFKKLDDPEYLTRSPIFVFAADPQASGGLQCLGRTAGHARTRPEFLALLRQFIKDAVIDGLLLTPADAEVLAVDERLFDESPVTPIVRMNAETGIWNPRSGRYRETPSLPFSTVTLKEAACGGAVRLGLYSLTLNNQAVSDEMVLSAYLQFARAVGAQPDFDHLLEVFLPNVEQPGMDAEAQGWFVADSIARLMSYLHRHQRPRFIKTAYTTPAVWEALTRFDPTLIVGALGGPRRNARATLQLAHDVTAYGGRAILFGRAIFEEESPRRIAQALRAVLDRTMTPEEAYREYQLRHSLSREVQ